jgi:hypothetical protein
MNLREIVGVDYVVRANRLAATCQPIGHLPGIWLASYPIFQDALCCGETAFGALPAYAKLIALKRTTIDMAEQATASKVLDDLGVSFMELSTDFVSEAVDSYLGRQQAEINAASHGFIPSLEVLAEQTPALDYPSTARPPCLLRPGRHIFIDGWMRFFSYRARGDLTIPVLAIDWLDFHGRLGTHH